MLARRPIHDVTESVAIDDARAAAFAVAEVLDRHFAGAYDDQLLRAGFADADRLFGGDYPGYLRCDMPYHDLRHSLDTALAAARMIDGYQSENAGSAAALSGDHALLGVLLALLHDTGFIRKADEAQLIGPALNAEHEARSVEFARTWLEAHAPADFAPLAPLIDATRLLGDLDELFAGRSGPAIVLGRILGTSDILSQLADRFYLERCRDHLFAEFALGGQNRTVDGEGREIRLYENAIDLLRKTPAFYDNMIVPRLENGLARMYRYLGVHFGGSDPYRQAMERNIRHLRRVFADDRLDLLRRQPRSTTTDLAPEYHAADER